MKGSILKEKYSWIWLVVLMTILNLLFYWKFIIGKEFFLALNDMDKENIMECQKGTHPIILSGKEQLWQ